MMKYVELAERLTRLQGDRPMLLVGVDAPGSSGKSTFAERLALCCGNAQVVRMDDLQGEGGGQAGPNGWVWGRLEREVIEPLLRGDHARFRVYDWSTRTIGAVEEVVKPSGIIIVDGLYSTRRELRGYYDFRIWVECPFNIKRERALERHARTRTSAEIDSWMTEERAYIARHTPQEHAHLVVSGASELDALGADAQAWRTTTFSPGARQGTSAIR